MSVSGEAAIAPKSRRDVMRAVSRSNASFVLRVITDKFLRDKNCTLRGEVETEDGELKAEIRKQEKFEQSMPTVGDCFDSYLDDYRSYQPGDPPKEKKRLLCRSHRTLVFGSRGRF